MRWTPGSSRADIEDRRGQRMSIGGRGLGLGGGAILLILSLLFGRNLFDDTTVSDPATAAPSGAAAPVAESPEEARLSDFVAFVLNDVQQTWATVLPKYGTPYHKARLVLFRDAVQSGCGSAQAAMGPFYCPVDERVYVDLGFFGELDQRFGASGDFAQAYVIAHELGHHVQHILGTDARVRQLQESRPGQANELSVRLELQADCYAGVWGRSTGERKLLEQGDIEEGLGAASAVGDDRLQRASTGSVHPESFTHGTSAQRATWFKRGFESGNPESCDTFAGGR